MGGEGTTIAKYTPLLAKKATLGFIHLQGYEVRSRLKEFERPTHDTRSNGLHESSELGTMYKCNSLHFRHTPVCSNISVIGDNFIYTLGRI